MWSLRHLRCCNVPESSPPLYWSRLQHIEFSSHLPLPTHTHPEHQFSITSICIPPEIQRYPSHTHTMDMLHEIMTHDIQYCRQKRQIQAPEIQIDTNTETESEIEIEQDEQQEQDDSDAMDEIAQEEKKKEYVYPIVSTLQSLN